MNTEMLSLERPSEGRKCGACGFCNPPRETICLGCAATRPTASGQSRCDLIEQQLRRACEGTISPEDLRGWLEDLSVMLAEKSRAILDYIDTSRYADDCADEVNIGLSGIETFESGLSELWHYTFDLDNSHLEKGRRMINDGQDLIVEAMRLNREDRMSLTLEWANLQDKMCA